MKCVIQVRGREWPESMGWQDTDFQPEDCTPAEWVAKMNDGDPQIEYRVNEVFDDVTFNLVELGNVLEALDLRKAYLVNEIKESEAADWDLDLPGLRKDLDVVNALVRRLERLERAQ